MNAALGSSPVTDSDSLEQSLEQELEQAARAGGRTVIAVPAPVRPTEVLLHGRSDDALAWATPGGFEIAGVGAALLLEARGPERFRQLARQGGELLARTRTVAIAGADPAPLRLFGGFSFEPEEPEAPYWRPFGQARFVLPELAYLVEGGSGRLLVALGESNASRGDRERLLSRALDALTKIERGVPVAPQPSSFEAETEKHADDSWTRLVLSIRDRISSGALEKVVLARRVSIELSAPLEPAQVLGRLRLEAAECTRFLSRAGGASFLGATPEILAKKRGAELATEAVAGSMSALDREGRRRLFESQKDRAEHALVVREILRALEPLAARVEKAPEPELHELRHVLHLRTPIRATLAGSPHLFDVVERLHPTPAVGGAPTEPALGWIRQHEPGERGWYAAPIGWFDGAGDGEMVVALRSGVLAGKTAHLYVGAGIVEHSQPDAEFAETRWKLAALLSALGLAGRA